MPAQPIPKSQASPGLLAFVATSKYVDGLPLYRLGQAVRAHRGASSRARRWRAGWCTRATLVLPLINLLRERMLEGGYIHCDETTVQVLDETGQERRSRSPTCGCRSAGTGEPPVVLFDYDPTRSGEVPQAPARGLPRLPANRRLRRLQRGRRELDVIRRLLCFAHARRYFVDALKALGINPNKLPAKPPDKARRLLTALGYIRTLYTIERRIREQAAR